MRWSFIALWLLGIFCFVSLIVSVGRDFRTTNSLHEQNIPLTSAGVNRLEVSTNSSTSYYGRNSFLDFEPFANFDEDTAYVNNIRLRITKSKSDSFGVTLIKVCNGRSRRYADTLANKMVYNISQVDSLLLLDKGIPITRQDKFRNQHVVITIAVPEGKVININKRLSWRNSVHFNGPWRSDEWEWNSDWDDSEIDGWENHYGKDLIMRADGLYTPDGKRADKYWDNGTPRDGNEWNNDNSDDNFNLDSISGGYRYDETQRSIDSLQILKERQMQKMKDSLKKVKDDIERSLEKLNEKGPEQQAFTPPFHDRKFDFVLRI